MLDLAETAAPGARVLVTLFFWRSLDLEGGSGLVAGVIRALEKAGYQVSLLIPGRPTWLPEGTATTSFLGRTAFGTALGYLRQLRALSKQVDLVLLLENSPTSHLLMGPLLPARTPTWVHISSPTVGSEILKLGLRRQYLAHWLGKSRFLAKCCARLFGFRFPHYVVSTDFQRRELEALGCGAGKAETLPFGVDPEAFRPADRAVPVEGSLVVGYLGHFSPIKGVPDLIAAFNDAVMARPGMELRLAWSGKGAESRRVLEMIESSPRPDRIRLLGRVDVAEFMRGLDVVCLPFRSGSIPHPPLVLLEALAMGVPVLTTRVGGLAELITEGQFGFTVVQGDREGLATALTRLCDDPELRRRMREQILELCPSRFSTERFCSAFEVRQAKVQGRGEDAA
jgi:glycosyltransferase involved in cell wall biosynthesis